MKYKVFLNNPDRKWNLDSNIRWLLINGKYSMPYNVNQTLSWPHVHAYMKEKYGDLYVFGQSTIPQNVIIETSLLEDPLGNETGNQVVASGNEEVQQQVV